ncbi:MAG TPA: serine hydrolase domain-containing protein [Flavilitoribacter sp.]|nr:serine hydrolase domain-containing protein [Flavilitoribacter sp.]
MFILLLAGLSNVLVAQIPATPAGNRLTGFLAMLENGDCEAFLRKEFAPSFFEQLPFGEALRVTQQIASNSKGFKVHSVTSNSDYELEALAQSKSNGAWRKLFLATEQAAPYRIASVGIDDADPPADVAAEMNETLVRKTLESPYPKGRVWVKGELGLKLDEFMTRQFHNGFSGAALVVKDSEVLLYKGYGLADRDKGVPVTTETLFDAGSIMKDFTDAAILKLESEGKLSTDDPVTRFFDKVPEDKRGITVHQLLYHSSGLPEYIGEDDETIGYEEGLKRIFSPPLRFEPGAKREYSNAGFTLLAAVIEKVSGKSYMDYITREIIEPAGLKSWAFFGQKERMPAGTDGAATGYDGISKGPFNNPYTRELPGWQIIGAGGISITLKDIWQFSLAIKAGKVLPPAAAKRFLEEYNPARPTPWNGPMRMFAGGSDIGFTMICMDFPEENAYVLMCSNTQRFSGPNLAVPLAKTLFGIPVETASDQPFEPKTAAEWQLPDSPAGDQAAAWLNAVCSDDPRTIRAYVQENFHPDMSKAHSEDDHVNFLRSVYSYLQTAPVLNGVKSTGNYAVEFHMQSEKTGENIKVVIGVEETAPYRINMLAVGD